MYNLILKIYTEQNLLQNQHCHKYVYSLRRQTASRYETYAIC